MSQVRFQADWNLHHIIAQAAQRREPTLDFQTARAANPLSVSDLDVLERAAREGTAAGHARFPRYAPAFCRLCPGTDECGRPSGTATSAYCSGGGGSSPDLGSNRGRRLAYLHHIFATLTQRRAARKKSGVSRQSHPFWDAI